jgi:MscS family membrane protein
MLAATSMRFLSTNRFARERAAPLIVWIVSLRAMLAVLFLAPSVLAAPVAATAQTVGDAAGGAKAEDPADVYGRISPRGLAGGLIDALAAQDFARAGQYFDLSHIATSRRPERGAEFARRLKAALDRGGTLMQPVQLSTESSGRIDDGLPPDEERIGSLPSKDGSEGVPLIAKSVTQEGKTVWLISPDSLAALAPAGAVGSGEALRDKLPSVLKETSVAGAPLADWTILLGTALFFYLLLRFAAFIALSLLCRVQKARGVARSGQMFHATATPLSLFLSMMLFLGTTRTMEVDIIARQLMNRVAGAIAFVAFAWFLWRLIDVAANMIAGRMEHSQRYRARSILVFARRALKVLLILFVGVQALNILGMDVTTGIAALGLGGLALALGAQKTVENVVGSISVVADEPMRVGDFCKVGDVTGTVEDIGIRSTRIRTNERTRVTIPNSNLAALAVENFSARDRYLFAPTLRLSADIDAEGLQRVLEEIRAGLKGAEYLYEGARANFKGFGDYSLDIEIFAWINVLDATEAIYLQEKLLLEIMRRIQNAGGSLAIPARALRIAEEGSRWTDRRVLQEGRETQ